MAEQGFNTGSNAMPGGAPEDPRVNSAALNAELKQAQILQSQTIKTLTETIKELTKRYDELTETNKKLSEDEARVAKILRDKIDALTQILVSVKQSAATGTPAPLSNVGIKERTETFTNLTTVIKSFQRSAAELKTSGKEIDFDSWFAEFIEQKKSDQLGLQQQQYNSLLLNDVKDILKQSGTSLANLSDDELEKIAKRSIILSIEQKQRELEVIQQNKDVIKLNKEATAQEIANTKELIESRKYDPSKIIIEKGFKGIGKDLDRIIENTKPRSLLKIILDLLGPFGRVIGFFISFVIKPLMFTFGILGGFLFSQYVKLKALGNLLSGDMFVEMFKQFVLVKNGLVFVYKDLPLIISSFVNTWASRTGLLFTGISRTGRFFGFIADASEKFFFFWTKLTQFTSEIFRVFSKLKTDTIVTAFTRILSPIAAFGRGIQKVTTNISDFAKRMFSPLITLFSSNKLLRLARFLDRFSVGLRTAMNFGLAIGQYLGKIFGPLTVLIRIISDMPLFFKGLFSGNFYTMIKSIMALVVQVAGLVLATIFGGPIGGLIASMTLKLENILKWFDPIFDFLIYLGALIFGSLWAIYEDFVSPAIEAIAKVVMTVLNLAFSILKPIFKIGQFILILLAPIFGILILSFKALGYVFKGIGMLADALTEYIIDPIFKFMNDFLFKFIQPVYDWIAETWIGKMLGMETKDQRMLREAAETAKKEKKEEKIEEKKEEEKKEEETDKKWFESLTDSVTNGVSDGISMGKNIGGVASDSVSSLVEVMKEHTEVVKTQTDALSSLTGFLGAKIKEKGTEIKENAVGAMDYIIKSNSMQYVTPRPATPKSQQDMMNDTVGYKPKIGDTIVNNNVVNNTTGSGGGMIPMIASGHMDPTKIALQISYRPPG